MRNQLLEDYAKKMATELGRPVGTSEAENEIIRLVMVVSQHVAVHFRFGYHSEEDMAQQAMLECLELLNIPGRYDVNRPLENFLHVHIKNRMLNFKRDHFMRVEPPCKCCDPFSPPPYPCPKWIKWYSRNLLKQNLMRPLDISSINNDRERNMSDASDIPGDLATKELFELIEERMPAELRADYLRIRSGVPVSKAKKEAIREIVREIIE